MDSKAQTGKAVLVAVAVIGMVALAYWHFFRQTEISSPADAPTPPINEWTITDLVTSVENKTTKDKKHAIEELGKRGREAQAAAPALIKLITDKELGTSASTALIQIGDAAVPALSHLLRAKDRTVRWSSLYVLQRIGPGARLALPGLMDILQDDDPGLVDEARQVLEKIGPGAIPALPALVRQIIEKRITEDNYRCSSVIGQMGTSAKGATSVLIFGLYGDEILAVTSTRTMLKVNPHFLKDQFPSVKEALDKYDAERRPLTTLGFGLASSRHFLPKVREVTNAWSNIGPIMTPYVVPEGWDTHPGKVSAEEVFALINELKTEDSAAREKVAVRLANVCTYARIQQGPVIDKAIPKLLDALPKTSELEQTFLAEAIIGIHLVSIKDPGQRESLRKAIDNILPRLASVAKGKNESARARAIWTIGLLGEEAGEGVALLCGLLSDKNELVRTSAAESLAKIGPAAKSGIPALVRLLTALDSGKACGAALYALQRIGPTAIPPCLEAAMIADRIEVRILAWQVIQKIGWNAELAIPLLRPYLTSPDPDARIRAIYAVAPFENMIKGVAPEILDTLADSDLLVRQAAWTALNRIPELSAVEKALRDTDSFVRLNAVFVVGNDAAAGFPNATTLLVEQMSSSDPNIRLLACYFLGRVPSREVVRPTLTAALKDEDPAVREAAAFSLARSPD